MRTWLITYPEGDRLASIATAGDNLTVTFHDTETNESATTIIEPEETE